MTITLEIRPETEAELRRQARISGRGLEIFVADLLEDALHLPSPEITGLTGQALIDASARVRGLFTAEELDELFRREPTTDRPVNFE